MPLTAPIPNSNPTINVDADKIRELLEQHRAARIDQIKACMVSDPMGDRTDPDVRRCLLHAARRALDEVDIALARMDEGSFGVCAGCCRGIGQERLYTVPYTRFCERCAGR
jgi:DnaK suppressor protein